MVWYLEVLEELDGKCAASSNRSVQVGRSSENYIPTCQTLRLQFEKGIYLWD